MAPQTPSLDRRMASQDAQTREASHVLTLEEIGNLAAEGGKPAETLMNVVALIARRFETDVCSVYLLEPDRANLVLAATIGLRADCVGVLRMADVPGIAPASPGLASNPPGREEVSSGWPDRPMTGGRSGCSIGES